MPWLKVTNESSRRALPRRIIDRFAGNLALFRAEIARKVRD